MRARTALGGRGCACLALVLTAGLGGCGGGFTTPTSRSECREAADQGHGRAWGASSIWAMAYSSDAQPVERPLELFVCLAPDIDATVTATAPDGTTPYPASLDLRQGSSGVARLVLRATSGTPASGDLEVTLTSDRGGGTQLVGIEVDGADWRLVTP